MRGRHAQIALFLHLSYLLNGVIAKATVISEFPPQQTCRPVNHILDSLPQQCPVSLNPSTEGSNQAFGGMLPLILVKLTIQAQTRLDQYGKKPMQIPP